MSLRPIVTRFRALHARDARGAALDPVPVVRPGRRGTVSVGVVTLLAVGLAACGGDDESGGARRLDEEAFCERLRQLDEAGQASPSDEIDEAFLTELSTLAAQAPTEELGGAIEVLGRVGSELAAIDENDPDAFGEALAAAFDPEFLSATETVESFAVGTCGLDPTDTGMDFSGSDDGFGDGFEDGSGDGAEDDLTGGPTGSAFDDLDAGALNDEVRPAIEQFAPDSQGSGITIFPSGDGTTVEVQVFSPSSLDPVGLCEALAAAVDAGTTDPTVTVDVSADGTIVASRPPGGTCAAT
jgi:hypothetical protein